MGWGVYIQCIIALGVTRQWRTAAVHFFGMIFDRIFIPARNVFSQICNISFRTLTKLVRVGPKENVETRRLVEIVVVLEPVVAGRDRTLGWQYRNRHR